MDMNEAIKIVDEIIEEKQSGIEVNLRWLELARKEKDRMIKIREVISQKVESAEELKQVARRILGEPEPEQKTGIKKPKTIVKYCPSCKIEKTTKDFYKDLSRKDNLHQHCKDCVKEYQKQRNKIKKKKEPTGWNVFKQFLDGKWRNVNVMKQLFKKEYPATIQRTIDLYMAGCKRYAQENLNLKYLSANKDGEWLFKISKPTPDIPISNGTKPDAIPVTIPNTADRKSDKIHSNWYKFRLGTKR